MPDVKKLVRVIETLRARNDALQKENTALREILNRPYVRRVLHGERLPGVYPPFSSEAQWEDYV